MTRVILIAAGRGSRLGHHPDSCPKCMVRIAGGRSILDHQLEAFDACGITPRDLHIVRGYLADKLVVSDATTYENEGWEDNNILHSLFKAEEAMQGAFLTTYSDIVYGADTVRALLASEADIALVVDTHWHEIYEGRTDHPVTQAELVEVDPHDAQRVERLGKWVGPERAEGEFIGLAKFSERGGEILKQVWHDLRARLGDDEPFQHASLFRKAYLADMINEIIDRGHRVELVRIEGGWREIDTIQDLERFMA